MVAVFSLCIQRIIFKQVNQIVERSFDFQMFLVFLKNRTLKFVSKTKKKKKNIF